MIGSLIQSATGTASRAASSSVAHASRGTRVVPQTKTRSPPSARCAGSRSSFECRPTWTRTRPRRRAAPRALVRGARSVRARGSRTCTCQKKNTIGTDFTCDFQTANQSAKKNVGEKSAGCELVDEDDLVLFGRVVGFGTDVADHHTTTGTERTELPSRVDMADGHRQRRRSQRRLVLQQDIRSNV